MSAQNFWNNFSFGFLNGMFNNNPFMGGCMSNFSCFSPFNSYFSGIPNYFSNYSIMPSLFSMPMSISMDMPAFSSAYLDTNSLFLTDNWQLPISDTFTFNTTSIFPTSSLQSQTQGDIFQNNTGYISNFSNYNFMFNSSSTIPTSYSSNSTSTSTTTNPEKSRVSGTSLQNLKGKHWSKMTDSEMKQVYGNYSRDITTLYKGTAEDLNKYLKGKGVLEGQGQAFMNAQKKYGISAAVLVGITMNESGGGTSKNARNKNNVGGVRIAGSKTFKTYSSVAACIEDIARFLKSGYVDNKRPLTKLYQINAKYCPTADTTDTKNQNSFWAKHVNMFTEEVEKATA